MAILRLLPRRRGGRQGLRCVCTANSCNVTSSSSLGAGEIPIFFRCLRRVPWGRLSLDASHSVTDALSKRAVAFGGAFCRPCGLLWSAVRRRSWLLVAVRLAPTTPNSTTYNPVVHLGSNTALCNLPRVSGIALLVV